MAESANKSTADRQRPKGGEDRDRERRGSHPENGGQTFVPTGLEALLCHASEHPEEPGLRPLVARQLLGLQASHGNQYVQRMIRGVIERNRAEVSRATDAESGFIEGQRASAEGRVVVEPPVKGLTIARADREEKTKAAEESPGSGEAAVVEAVPDGAMGEAKKAKHMASTPEESGSGKKRPAATTAGGESAIGAARPKAKSEGRGAAAGMGPLARQRSAGNAAVARKLGQKGPVKRRGRTRASVQRSIVIPPADAREEHESTGSGGTSESAQPGAEPGGAEAAPAAGAPPAGGSETPPSPGAPGEGAEGETTGAGPGQEAEPLSAKTLDQRSAELVGEFIETFGSRQGELTGPAARLLDPRMRRAAARLMPERASELARSHVQRTPSPEHQVGNHLQRPGAAVQRQGTGTIPTRKVKVTIPNWPKISLFKDKNLGSWFLLSGSVESPTWEGEAKPPDSMRDDTKEEELQFTADGKVSGYAETFHKETLAKVGSVEVEGKIGVEVTSKSVKVSGLSVKLPDLGGESGLLLQGQFDFDLLEWEAGEPPSLMVLSYTQKVGMKSGFSEGGWTFTGSLFLPIKLSIKPNPAKVAQYVTRVVGPRLAAAAPAALAIAAPLAAGGVCLALWMNAIKAGEDFAKAIDLAKGNTIGYVSAYFDTIMGYSPKFSNSGAAQGKAAAQKVLDELRWSELPEGAQKQIREQYINAGTMDLAGVQVAMWKSYRSQAIAWYRKEHDWDAWAYDKGLPSDLKKLIGILDIVAPPWSQSSY